MFWRCFTQSSGVAQPYWLTVAAVDIFDVGNRVRSSFLVSFSPFLEPTVMPRGPNSAQEASHIEQ